MGHSPFLLAHLNLWNTNFDSVHFSAKTLGINGGGLAAPTLIVIFILQELSRRRDADQPGKTLSTAGVALHFLWMISLNTLLYHSFSIETYLLLNVITALLALLVTIKFPSFTWRTWLGWHYSSRYSVICKHFSSIRTRRCPPHSGLCQHWH